VEQEGDHRAGILSGSRLREGLRDQLLDRPSERERLKEELARMTFGA